MNEFGRKSKALVLEKEVNGSKISIETGWIAKQAGGSVVVRQGDTMVLVTVCTADARPDQSFFPLTVDYIEKSYAAGRIPGGFFKREGRPGEQEILTARLIDRPIRPFFPKGFMNEVQIICTVLSADAQHQPDVLAMTGASAAIHLSELPFEGPIAGVRVGRVDGEFVANPTISMLTKSDMDFVIAGSRDAIVMVEGGAQLLPEETVLDALFFGHEQLQTLLDLQEELRQKLGTPKVEFVAPEKDKDLASKVASLVGSRVNEAVAIAEKSSRKEALSAIREEALTALAEEFEERQDEIKSEVDSLVKDAVRRRVLKDGVRIDGRGLSDVRPIECEVGFLPRVHGSALFTRGETQAIVATTLGTSSDTLRVDTLSEQYEKSFMLHYNFPPFSTGECKPLRGTARREIGHGTLAERALRPIIPPANEFPYVIRVVSDVTESNGSSSMASVCGGSMSLMAAGVKTKAAIGGVAMGLMKEGDDVAVLTDILGDEDHLGDMDFKVCGSKEGISALQMDIKCSGLSREIMSRALGQARDARMHILECMSGAISEPSQEMSPYAPQIHTMKINPDKIRDVIGPGGKTIRSIVESTGVKIDIEDSGIVNIASSDPEATKRAIEIINGLTEEAEVGKIYTGVVKRIADFGAFVEILPGVDGLLHISQLAHERVRQVSDVVREGDEVTVRVLDIDRQGRIRLSRKDLLDQDAGDGEEAAEED